MPLVPFSKKKATKPLEAMPFKVKYSPELPPRWDLTIDAGLKLREELRALREFITFRQNVNKLTNAVALPDIAANYIRKIQVIIELISRLLAGFNRDTPIFYTPSEQALQNALQMLSQVESNPDALERLYLSLLSLTPPTPPPAK